MKKLFNLLLTALVTVTLFSCEDDPEPVVTKGQEFAVTQSNGMTVVSGSTEENYTLKANQKYMLKDFVYVKSGATLTIEPGTVIMGDKNTMGTLIIERGAKIMAEGTTEKPIVFTSALPAGSRNPGDWGGIIVLGAAPVNLPGGSGKIEGGVNREFGGANAADNSGVLKYVRIEFPGIAFSPDNEINGLTLGGVGSGTMIDYVQVSYCGDDSFEMFGGTVNAKHLIAFKTVDDMFDTDNGYSGKLQFLLGISDPTLADASGSNGFESDGDANGTAATPKTSAIFSNVSLFGPRATATTTHDSNFRRGLHIRRNSNIQLHNALVTGWPTGLLLDGTATQANATAGTMAIKNTVLSGTGNALTVESGGTFDVATWFNAAGKGNSVVADNATLNSSGGFNQTTRPVFTGNNLQSGATFDGMDTWFERVSFRGAFGAEDWTAGWANFDPKATAY